MTNSLPHLHICKAVQGPVSTMSSIYEGFVMLHHVDFDCLCGFLKHVAIMAMLLHACFYHKNGGLGSYEAPVMFLQLFPLKIMYLLSLLQPHMHRTRALMPIGATSYFWPAHHRRAPCRFHNHFHVHNIRGAWCLTDARVSGGQCSYKHCL